MAAPETQFQPATVQATGFTPTVTQLGGSHLFGGAGELWAGVGRTALAAAGQLQSTAQMVQQSPLNPMVRAQEQAQQRASQEGVKQADWADSLPDNYGRWMYGTDAAGNAVLKPAAEMTPTYQMHITPPATPPEGGGGDGKTKKTTTTNTQQQEQQQNDFQQHPENYILNPSTGSYERRADAPPLTSAPAPGKTTKPAPGPPKDAADANAEPPLPNQSSTIPTTGNIASTGSGAGEGNYALNPQPDPLVQHQSAADYRAEYQAQHPDQYQGYSASAATTGAAPPQPTSSIYSPGRPAPLAPPAPTGPAQPPAQPSTPGTVPGSLSDQYAQQQKAQQDVALQNWQNQTQTEPMTADDAMDWMRRRTTLAQDATYLPHGGPNGEPAYAFHMKTPGGKTGGVNTVPISQMVQNGAGPTVASQNTSQVLSQSDRLKQQQQNALAAPPDQSQQPPPDQPNISPPPPANLPQQPNVSPPPPPNLPQQPNISGPPPAPVGPAQPPQGQPPTQYPNISGPPPPAPGLQAARQPITDVNGNPLSSFGAVASKGGPAAETLSAQVAGANQPVVAPEPISQTITAPAPTLSDEDKKAVVDLQNAAPPEQAEDDVGDPTVGKQGGYTWKKDLAHGGRLYTTLPGTSNTFNEQRWYLGEAGYREYKTPEGEQRNALEQASLKNTGIHLSHAQIADMPIQKVLDYLDYAKWDDNTAGKVVGDTTTRLDSARKFIQYAEYAKDIINSQPNTYEYSRDALKTNEANTNAVGKAANTDPFGFLDRFGGTVAADFTKKHLAAVQMDEAVQHMSEAMKEQTGSTNMPGGTPAKPGGSFSMPISTGKAFINPTYTWQGSPATQDPLKLPAIQGLQDAGVSKEEKLARINALEAEYVRDFKNTFHGAMTDRERVDSHYREDFKTLADGKSLSVANNMFRPNGPNGPLHNPYGEQPAKPVAETEAAAKAVGALPQRVGTYQPPMANSIQDVQKITASHKSGTRFHYTTPDGKVFEYAVQ